MKNAGGIIPALSGLEFFLPPASERKTKVMFDNLHVCTVHQ